MGVEVAAEVDADESRQPPLPLTQHRQHRPVGDAAQMGLHRIGREEVPGVWAVLEKEGTEFGDVSSVGQAHLQIRGQGIQSSPPADAGAVLRHGSPPVEKRQSRRALPTPDRHSEG
ncbi:hypothetical protein D9M68_964270 [compost metagenome]